MWSVVVINIHRFFQHLANLFDILEVALEIEFRFYYSIYPFCYGILIRITRNGHTDLDVVAFQQADIFLAAVLYSPIRMMDQSRF